MTMHSGCTFLDGKPRNCLSECDATIQSYRVLWHTFCMKYLDHWYAMLNLYGGKKKVANIMRHIKHIPARDAFYAAIVLEIDKKELSCCAPRV